MMPPGTAATTEDASEGHVVTEAEPLTRKGAMARKFYNSLTISMQPYASIRLMTRTTGAS